MKDTPQAIQDLYRRWLMERSGAERLKMACDMFDASRTLVRASLQAQAPPGEDLRVRLFLRTYGADFAPERVEDIVKKLACFDRVQRQRD